MTRMIAASTTMFYPEMIRIAEDLHPRLLRPDWFRSNGRSGTRTLKTSSHPLYTISTVEEGFEPPVRLRTSDFKSGAISRSATLPFDVSTLVRRCLGMTIRAEKPKVSFPIIKWISVDVVNVEHYRPPHPIVTSTTRTAVLYPRLDQTPSQHCGRLAATRGSSFENLLRA